MKNLFVVLVCISILFTGCCYNSTPQLIPSENQSNNYDFRNSNWGDSIEQVRKIESMKPFLDSGSSLVYNDAKILDLSCSIMYMFYDGKLLNGGYVFDEKHSSDNLYYEDYLKLVAAYTEKYGKPTSSEEIWIDELFKDNPKDWGFAIKKGDAKFTTHWITSTSTIDIVISGDNGQFSTVIVYKSFEYEHRQNTDGI